jgi:molybdopterin molybdotransferase
MKHLLSGVAIVAALAIAAPASAQRTGPGVGAPGPNQPVPGGPGPSSPLSNLPASPSRDTPYPPPPAATAPGSPGMSSAMPPAHRPARATKGKMAGKGGRTQLTGTTANQLNAEELARLQAGNFSNPPPPGARPR